MFGELVGLLAVKIADNRNYSDTHEPLRESWESSCIREAYIAPNCTRRTCIHCAASLSGKYYIVVDFRRY